MEETSNENVPNGNDEAHIARSDSLPDIVEQETHNGLVNSISDNRILIEPYGDGFIGTHTTSGVISRIIQSHFRGPYTRFSIVPMNVRNLWFNEFGKRFKWNFVHEAQVRKNWEISCKKRLTDKLNRVREFKADRSWILPEYWTVMEEYYQSEKFKKQSQAGKKNRASGGATHTGGSISFTEHIRRERKRKGKDFNIKESCRKVHMFERGSKKGNYVNEKARAFFEKVDMLEQQSIKSSSGSVDMEQILVEAAEGIKKGRIYGLGSEGAEWKRKSTLSIGSSQINESEARWMEEKMMQEREKMTKRIKKDLRSEVKKDVKDKVRTAFSGITEWMNNMACAMASIGVPMPQTPNFDFDMMFETDDDEDNENSEDDNFHSFDHHSSRNESNSQLPSHAAAPCEIGSSINLHLLSKKQKAPQVTEHVNTKSGSDDEEETSNSKENFDDDNDHDMVSKTNSDQKRNSESALQCVKKGSGRRISKKSKAVKKAALAKSSSTSKKRTLEYESTLKGKGFSTKKQRVEKKNEIEQSVSSKENTSRKKKSSKSSTKVLKKATKTAKVLKKAATSHQ